MTILAALDDPNLLGAAFPEPTAVFGLPMAGEQAMVYGRHTGRTGRKRAKA